MSAENIVDVYNIKKYFLMQRGFFSRARRWIKAVNNVTFSIRAGETFGLVGESGCGKTTTAKVILLLEELTDGSIFLRGKNIAEMNHKELRQYRGSVQAVFQDPYSSLNPRMRVGSIVGEPLVVNTTLNKKAVKEKVKEMLCDVGMNLDAVELYPHEFSGGQRQRIGLARALALGPSLIILDEPVSALDVSIAAQIMNLMNDLQDKLGVAYLLIAHSLATIRYMSHWVAVMYLGQIVEYAPSEELYCHHLHPYTKALLSAALPYRPGAAGEEVVLSGEVGSPLNLPSGCHFYPRCSFAKAVCAEAEPTLKEVASGHAVACHLY